nr:hypothetical protein CFP56_32186 [Quercus suber]
MVRVFLCLRPVSGDEEDEVSLPPRARLLRVFRGSEGGADGDEGEEADARFSRFSLVEERVVLGDMISQGESCKHRECGVKEAVICSSGDAGAGYHGGGVGRRDGRHHQGQDWQGGGGAGSWQDDRWSQPVCQHRGSTHLGRRPGVLIAPSTSAPCDERREPCDWRDGRGAGEAAVKSERWSYGGGDGRRLDGKTSEQPGGTSGMYCMSKARDGRESGERNDGIGCWPCRLAVRLEEDAGPAVLRNPNPEPLCPVPPSSTAAVNRSLLPTRCLHTTTKMTTDGDGREAGTASARDQCH